VYIDPPQVADAHYPMIVRSPKTHNHNDRQDEHHDDYGGILRGSSSIFDQNGHHGNGFSFDGSGFMAWNAILRECSRVALFLAVVN
jgi:hypothetical protein